MRTRAWMADSKRGRVKGKNQNQDKTHDPTSVQYSGLVVLLMY